MDAMVVAGMMVVTKVTEITEGLAVPVSGVQFLGGTGHSEDGGVVGYFCCCVSSGAST